MSNFPPEKLLEEVKEMHSNGAFLSLYKSLQKKGLKYDVRTETIVGLGAPKGNPTPEKFPIRDGLPVIDNEASYIRFAVRNIIDQFVVQSEIEHITKDMSDKLIISDRLLSISKDLTKAVREFDTSTEPDHIRIHNLKMSVMDKYESIQAVKKFDFLHIHQFSVLPQMHALIEADLQAKQINAALDDLQKSFENKPTSALFAKSREPNPVPGKDVVQLSILKNRLKLITENHEMPDRDKIVAMNLISQDTKEYIQDVTNRKNFHRSPDVRNKLQKFSRKLDKIESGYTVFSDRMKAKFSKLETKHSLFASIASIWPFSKIKKVREFKEKHQDYAQHAKIAQRACDSLKKSGNGNNKEKLAEVLDSIINVGSMSVDNYLASDVQAVARKLKEEITVLKEEADHFKKYEP